MAVYYKRSIARSYNGFNLPLLLLHPSYHLSSVTYKTFKYGATTSLSRASRLPSLQTSSTGASYQRSCLAILPRHNGLWGSRQALHGRMHPGYSVRDTRQLLGTRRKLLGHRLRITSPAVREVAGRVVGGQGQPRRLRYCNQILERIPQARERRQDPV